MNISSTDDVEEAHGCIWVLGTVNPDRDLIGYTKIFDTHGDIFLGHFKDGFGLEGTDWIL